MSPEPRTVQRVYLILMLFNTLAASFIWGINTLFLLDAGLNATAAFAANALFTAGMVAFEVPTGVVADTWGRRAASRPRPTRPCADPRCAPAWPAPDDTGPGPVARACGSPSRNVRARR